MTRPRSRLTIKPPDEDDIPQILEELDRLEELLEDMDALSVSSRQEIAERMAALHARVDELEGA